jgi:cell fate regulator YaaT (PSP1 superfamily)
MSEQQKTEQRTVVAVRLRYNPKTFWFDPVLSTYETGDHVLVDTERGREIGLVIDPAVEVTEKQLKQIKSPLKPVIRALTETDFERIDELDAKGREAMPVFRELIEKHGLDMKPVSVEFLFSGEKAVFYFSSDTRVDFRELVRDLASRFHTRVDMRQIGVRDEARILGGLAHCGEELCCARLGGDFQPVSIRMAKEQDLPLNPAKISGACGRLMCCLRYEFEAYRDFKNRAPRKGTLIETPMGQAKVIDFDTPREVITMRLEDGKQLSIPLAEFDCSAGEDGKPRPCRVSREAIDRCASSGIIMALAALEQELVRSKDAAERGRDRGGSGGGGDRGGDRGGGERVTRRPRKGGRGRGAAAGAGGGVDTAAGGRGRSGDAGRSSATGRGGSASGNSGAGGASGGAGGASGGAGGVSGAASADDREGASSRRKGAQKSRPRPGQHSSGLRAGGDGGPGSGNAGSGGDRAPGSGGSRGSRGRGGNRSGAQAANPTAGRSREQAGSGGGDSAGAGFERQGGERQGGEGRRRRRRRPGGGE